MISNLTLLLSAALLCAGCARHYSGLYITQATRGEIPKFVKAVETTAHELNLRRFASVEGEHDSAVLEGPNKGTHVEHETLRSYTAGDYVEAAYQPSRAKFIFTVHPFDPYVKRGADLLRIDTIVTRLAGHLQSSFSPDRIFLWGPPYKGKYGPTLREGVSLAKHPVEVRQRN